MLGVPLAGYSVGVPTPAYMAGGPTLAALPENLLAPSACRRPILSLAGRDPRRSGSLTGVADATAAITRGYQRGLSSWEAETVRRREAAAEDFASWCQQLPADLRIDWASVSPRLVVGYLEGHYVPARGTREICPGLVGPAASTLEGHVAHLRATFRLMGRALPWGAGLPAQCNPRLPLRRL